MQEDDQDTARNRAASPIRKVADMNTDLTHSIVTIIGRALIPTLTVSCALLLTACNKADAPGGAQVSTSAATVNVSDVDITTHVKSAFNSDPSLAGLDIAVVTTKGDIRLTGVVSSQAQIEKAVSAARAAEGAHTIHNELTLKQ